MGGTHDNAPVARVEKGVDAGAPDTESLTVRVEGRTAELQAIRGTNEALQGEVIQLEAAVGVDPEAATVLTNERAAMQEQAPERYDFNSVAKVFADLITRMEAEGASKERIAQAREGFAKAAVLYAQEKAGNGPSSRKWYSLAHNAFAALPLSRETISPNDATARKFDVPEGDHKFIIQTRETYMGLDGKADDFQWVRVELAEDAPLDVRRRVIIADQKEQMQKVLSRREQKVKKFSELRKSIVERARLLGADSNTTQQALFKADELFYESQKAVDKTERMYKQRMREIRMVRDDKFFEGATLDDIFNQTQTGDALKQILELEVEAADALIALANTLQTAAA